MPLIVDNTLATPYLIRPIDHGADIVVHSLTKFLGGHGNSLGGIIVDAGTFDWSKDNKYPMLSEPRPEYHGIKIQETFGNFAFAIACRVLGLRDLGPAISPFNAFLILTGIETLPLRMQKHCENAKAVAEFLAGHPAVAAVNYSGLPGNKYNNLARKYAPKGAGAVFTFSLKGGYEAGVNLVSNLKLFSHLANVGDTRSLVIHPASTTHSQLDDAAKIKSGAAPDVVRLSIGIEDKEDLIADLEQALGARAFRFQGARKRARGTHCGRSMASKPRLFENAAHGSAEQHDLRRGDDVARLPGSEGSIGRRRIRNGAISGTVTARICRRCCSASSSPAFLVQPSAQARLTRRKATATAMIINLLFLLSIIVLPVTTGLLGSYARGTSPRCTASTSP